MSERIPGFATLAVHAGAQPDPTTGARATPIYQTTSYVFEGVDHAASLFGLQTFGNIYTRIGNPTNAVLEERVAALEGGTAGLAVGSGHAAQVLAFHCLMQPGDEFVASKKLYGGSINQFNHAFKNFGWNVVWADPDDVASFERADLAEDQGDLHRVDRQSRRRHHRHRGGRADRAPRRRALHRRQHAGDALSVQADRAWRRHRRSFADQISRRPRQFDRRHDRRCRHLQLVARAALSDAVRAAAGISRHRAARDVRQFRLRHRLPRAGAARHRPGAVAVQRFPDPHRHRDAAAADAARIATTRSRSPNGSPRIRKSRGSAIPDCPATAITPSPRNTARTAPARCSPSGSRAATTPASSSCRT